MLKYEENRNFGFFPLAEYNINVENIPYSKFIILFELKLIQKYFPFCEYAKCTTFYYTLVQ